ncbi:MULTISPECIES: DUF1648 domain-containing protein [unclassified Streptosporangium]|uniref:DUF1648 domain-containing protein n=1 Tax=unclassified Streptosporangium TaxID=2632669 RepID=UPI002E27F953|nr:MULTISPECIES: DUF1648 domain-containing protein [unclassified Streptosporangium]
MTGPGARSFEGVTDVGLRARFLSIAAGWVALVTAELIAAPLVLRDRLPDPIATHWGPSGAPDNSMPFIASLLFQVGLWVLLAGGAWVLALTNTAMFRRRASRMGLGALLGGAGLFLPGLQAVTLVANLDAPDWGQATDLGWGALLAVAGLVLGGWIGALAARPGPDDHPEPSVVPTRRLRLRPGQRAVWVSSVSSGPLVALGGSVLAAGLGCAVLALIGGDGALRVPATIMSLAGLVGVTFSSVRVQVTEEGLALFYGPFRLPRKHIPIERVERAWSEELFPSSVGGWGVRGLPGAVTVMIRSGECLVVGYVSGGRFAVSIDDAESGAALLNTLADRASTGPSAR